MNPDSQNFDQLQKLLALKRHEAPPPGYFDRFSGEVMAKIKTANQREPNLGWAKKLWSVFEAKPMLTGAFGAALCALAISGIVFSEDVQPIADGTHSPVNHINLAAGGSIQPVALNQANSDALFSPGTNGVSPDLARMLNQLPGHSQLPVNASFGFPSGN